MRQQRRRWPCPALRAPSGPPGRTRRCRVSQRPSGVADGGIANCPERYANSDRVRAAESAGDSALSRSFSDARRCRPKQVAVRAARSSAPGRCPPHRAVGRGSGGPDGSISHRRRGCARWRGFHRRAGVCQSTICDRDFTHLPAGRLRRTITRHAVFHALVHNLPAGFCQSARSVQQPLRYDLPTGRPELFSPAVRLSGFRAEYAR